jgi:DNA polymerase III delta subunit
MQFMPSGSGVVKQNMNYLLHGDNSFGINQYVQNLIKEFIESNSAEAVIKVDGEELEPADLARFRSQDLFNPVSMFVVSEISENKNIVQQITEENDVFNTDNIIVFVEGKLKKNSLFYKKFTKEFKSVELNKLPEHELLKWIGEYAKNLGGEISTQDAKYLVSAVGDDQQLLHNEIDKLVLFDKKISRQAIDELVEKKPSDNVFELLDFLAKGDGSGALQIYESLRQAQLEPYYILNMIGWQLSNMSVVFAADSNDANAIASANGMSPFVVRKTMGSVKRLNRGRLREMVNKAAETDIKTKSSKADADQLVKALIMELAG